MTPDSNKGDQLRLYYQRLFDLWGRQHWWPARTRFEVIVGTYLTQNTSWTNVERALRQLRSLGVLSIAGIRDMPVQDLETAVRSAGYFRQKGRRLKLFVRFLDERHGGSLRRMLAQPTEKLRIELLSLEGVGRETADSILLYAGQHPVFVVDAYTRRILERHGILSAEASYDDVRVFCEQALAQLAGAGDRDPADRMIAGGKGASHPPSRMSTAKRSPLAQVFNEMHGLIVGVGKNYCFKTDPDCERCPLGEFMAGGISRRNCVGAKQKH